MKTLTIAVAVALTVAVGARDVRVQAQAVAQPSARKPNVSLQVQVVISRYQGEKKISSVPYTLAVVANSRPSQLRAGARVPVPSVTPMTVKGKPLSEADPNIPTGGISFNYQEIGTNIDCMAQSTDDGAFELNLSIDDSSIYVDDKMAPGGPPIVRQFRAQNGLILRDGQSTQFTAATDKVSGEVIRIDVTLKVVK